MKTREQMLALVDFRPIVPGENWDPAQVTNDDATNIILAMQQLEEKLDGESEQEVIDFVWNLIGSLESIYIALTGEPVER